jgi:hypothetical protein
MSNFLVLGPGCGGNFWVNPNIMISTGIFNVAQPTTISVSISNNSGEQVRVNGVQVTVCAWNTMHGFNSASILPSLQSGNGLSWDNVFPFPNDVVLPPNGTTTISLPSWTPQASDIHHFDNVPGAAFENITKTSLHCCIFANCLGSFPPVNTGAVTDDGALVTWSNAVVGNFCADTHHGQHNISLHRLVNQRRITIPFYAGLAGEREIGSANVFLREIIFDPRTDAVTMDLIQRAGLGALPVQAAPVPATGAGLARFRSVAKRVEEKVEEVADEIKEGIEHLAGHWSYEDDENDSQTPQSVLTLNLSANELHPLLLKVAFDKDDPVGAVHVFDVVQANSDGSRGGFRLATINAP